MQRVSIENVDKKCPTDIAYSTNVAEDPDLQKSIANGFIAGCGTRCVYDHRNPKTGWTFNGNTWERVSNMGQHRCGVAEKDALRAAISNYEKLYDVKNAWSTS